MSDWADLADEELIASSQVGSKEAFGELVRRYRERIQATVYRFRAGNFRSWMYRIAINTAIDFARRARPTVDIEDLPLATPGDDPESAVLHIERAQAIRRAVLRLPPHSRAALILREYEGLSYKEIAAALDIPLGTVMSRLNYARNHLQADLAPLLEEAHASTNH